MAELKNIPKKKYDVAIIGSSLTAYIVALSLSRKLHLSVCLLDADAGRENSSDAINIHSLDTHFSHLSLASETFEKVQSMVSELIHDSYLEPQETPLSTLTIESGSTVPFLGFSDKNFRSQSIVSELIPVAGYKTLLNTTELIQRIRTLFIGDIYSLATVTEFVVDSTDGAQRVSQALVNGDLKLNADLFVSCLSPEETINLLPLDTLPAKTVQKVAKLESWSKISLFFELPVASEVAAGQYALMGQKNDFEPCFGEVHVEGEKKFARFSCLAPDDISADHEYFGSVIRYMKRQIKRLDAQFFETVLSERMSVANQAEAFADLGLKSAGEFPQVSGLFLAHGSWQPEFGLLAELKASETALSLISELKDLPEIPPVINLATSPTPELNPPS